MMNDSSLKSDAPEEPGEIAKNAGVPVLFFGIAFLVLLLPVFLFDGFSSHLFSLIAFENLVLFCLLLCFSMGLLAAVLKDG